MKKSKTAELFAIVALGLALAGCPEGGSSNPDDILQGCTPITGGGTRYQTNGTTSRCPGCKISEPGNAIDGNGATFATLYIPERTPAILALRAIAQPGVVYPEGSPVGIVHSLPPGTDNGLGGSLATYLQGVMQEQFDVNGTRPDPRRSSFIANFPFDAVEIRLAQVGNSGPKIGLRAYEFCAG